MLNKICLNGKVSEYEVNTCTIKRSECLTIIGLPSVSSKREKKQ